jgi:hypothetical protein
MQGVVPSLHDSKEYVKVINVGGGASSILKQSKVVCITYIMDLMSFFVSLHKWYNIPAYEVTSWLTTWWYSLPEATRMETRGAVCGLWGMVWA